MQHIAGKGVFHQLVWEEWSGGSSMPLQEEMLRSESLLVVARAMLLAARTAPKGRGRDLLEALLLTGAEPARLAVRMRAIGEERQAPAFVRDAANIEGAPVVVLLGTRAEPLGLKVCGYCGFADCAAMQAGGGRCAFNSGDLGIALGSAVAAAADARVDNRIMYTAGFAAIREGFFSPDVRIAYAIPLSATGKNPFFDRV
jgi:uncharacterized ferredoxin-like protein